MTSTPAPRGGTALALLSMAVGAFGIGMTEFVSMGLLPGIAGDLLRGLYETRQEDAIAQAGILISLYALGVVIGAPTIAAFVARFPRNRVMIGLLLALLLANGLSVVAPTFETMAAARFLAGLPHGAYFGMATVVASELLGPTRRGHGIAMVMSGLTIANVVGVPGGTFLGQFFGWRVAYAVVVVVFALALVMCAIFIPAHEGDKGGSFLGELRIFRIPQVWMTVALGSIGFGAFFAIYSYISTLMTEAAGGPEWAVPIALVAIGLGMVVGNIIGGRLADRSVRRTLLVGLSCVAVMSGVVAVAAAHPATLVVALFVFGTMSQVTVPSIQLRLLDVAGDYQSIGAALNHSALNIGNSLGAALGGVVIAAGLGYAAPAWLGVLLSALGVLIAVASFAMDRRGVTLAA
ncbi:MFS transporter [Microbacterium nanhaiense]|uniref:MFS transporter n=1 Tax=Microbacterium nanhaiense TaxID=1301026 RepID=A0ABQ2N1M4_9MICO|nr:MFS transporter [Microbacterium nanhaiense]GGO62502.1 MFS transporter [Microbacterium nanhaiense]